MKYKYIKPLLFLLDPEFAHNLAIFRLKYLPLFAPISVQSPMLTQNLWGMNFNNPIGMAAGFDKNAEVIYPLLKQGFGFVEAGTVTPKPQPGNKKPRLFRLKEDKAVINRLGFNNKGVSEFESHIRKFPELGIIGANIGKNKNQEDAVADYILLLKRLYGKSDYITVNISSPNTPGLRDLQEKEALSYLLSEIMDTRNKLAEQRKVSVPIMLKMAPDVTQDQEDDIAEAVIKYKVDGLIVSNTTIGNKDSLESKYRDQQGGLSGAPLFYNSTKVLRSMYNKTGKNIPIIGVGGISSAEDAYNKIKSGASLVQIYSAFVYQGFSLVNDIVNKMPKLLEKDGFTNISQAIGVDT